MLPLFTEYDSIDAAKTACELCIRCRLSAAREKVVWGAGDPDAQIMLIGQGPSLIDNRTGKPYSGPAGELLDTALEQAGLRRESVWTTNIHKCVAVKESKNDEPPQIRPPRVAEVKACRPWLDEEFIWIKPQVLVIIGGPAAQSLLGKEFQLTEQRGEWQDGPHGWMPTLATFQPTYLKRLSQWDRPAAVEGWRNLVDDLRKAKARIEQQIQMD